jgi:dipeptidyl aminopeptidase/acylaminoacyl peptidase
MLLASFSGKSQTMKQEITPADFDKWGTLSGETIAPDGKWVSYRMRYENGRDTLFLLKVKNKQKMAFPKAVSVTFAEDGLSAMVRGADNFFSVVNLVTLHERSFANVVNAQYSPDGHILILVKETSDSQLFILMSSGRELFKVDHVDEFAVSANNKVAVIEGSRLKLLNLKGLYQPVEIIKESAKLKGVTWSSSGNSLAVFAQSDDSVKNTKIKYYDCRSATLLEIDTGRTAFDNVNYRITNYSLLVSGDDNIVFFTVKPRLATDDTSKVVEVWDAASPLEYPEQKFYNDPNNMLLRAAWNVGLDTIIKLDNDAFTESTVLPANKYFISASQLTYAPHWKQSSPTDYYITPIGGGKPVRIAEYVNTAAHAISASPSGKYLAWFKDGDYWIYNTETQTARNVTKTLNGCFYNPDHDTADENSGYAVPGFTSDDRYLMIYDKYDIWLIASDGSTAERITNGKEMGIRFRIVSNIYEPHKPNIFEYYRPKLNINEGLIVSAFGDDKSSGYYCYSPKKELSKMVYKKAQCNRLVKASASEKYLYVEQTAEQPPQLMIFDTPGGKPRSIVQTNPHYKNYSTSHAELLSYKNASGEMLQGILRYPSNYEPGKKYPMVVFIYEVLSPRLNEYLNPTHKYRTGFNPANYFTDGYFVLFPDIKYKLGEPGLSAADCVKSAVASVVARDLVEESKIGLWGHSYGGYETSFIITQTSLFAAAVAGAAVTDLTSSYFTMNFNTNRSDGWSIESQQLRIANSPFECPEAYTLNSPIVHAAKITTPLLSWAGKDDQVVNFEQSIELHLALRRLQKPNLLLLYPGEGHILNNPEAQQDLTDRTKDWFDHYLKGKTSTYPNVP